MIKSMTGFGKAGCEIDGKSISVEIRSLNSKQMDLNVRIPNQYKEKESEIRSLIAKKLERGKVDLAIFLEYTQGDSGSQINKEVVSSYVEQLNSIAHNYEIPNSSAEFLGIAMRLPDAMKQIKEEIDEKEWNQIEAALNEALTKLDQFRVDEGNILETDFSNRINNIQSFLNQIQELEPNRTSDIKDRIKNNLEELVGNDSYDKNRMEQEIIYYLEKMDISEEMIRLKSHCDYFNETLALPVSNGKKLGFICQEIGREINTIGSKVNNADLQKIVVQMKDELEKVKEQVLNIL